MRNLKKMYLLLALVVGSNQSLFAQNNSYSWQNLPKINRPVFKADTFSIINYGAVANGSSLNTKAINNAIAQCSAGGGGVVLIPDGYWLSGPIYLENNVNLHLSNNAFLQFTADFNQYKIIEGNYEGKPSARNESPIMAVGLQNIAITGNGIIDGNGDAWRMVNRDQLTEREWKAKIASGGLVSTDNKVWFPSAKTKKAYLEKSSVLLSDNKKLSDFEPIKDYLRPNLVLISKCQQVLLEGVTFQNSPAWNLHPFMSQHLTVSNIRVKNPDYAQNGDGIDIESCSNVLLENSVFDVGDDAICIKSGKDEEGRKRNTPTENVIIRNNTVYAGHGGFVVGSEMSGGARNIFVSDCSFVGTDKGLRFKTTRGRGGVVEKIYIKNINMSNIVQEAIYFDMYYWTKPPLPNQKVEVPTVSVETPQFKDVEIENVVCNGASKGIFMRGLPEMAVKNISIKNTFLKANVGIELIDVAGIKVENTIVADSGSSANIYVENGRDILLSGLKFKTAPNISLDINGERSRSVVMENYGLPKSNVEAKFSHGANKEALRY
ncbi:glycoside hydrolase [Pelobium manganitolerans]|uniref:Glycoside hydrolase n=1 Tax=Pelobium manganitolerans TaxID=1842495 RepID=A0A419S769_9SPHI|nr:glycoside hydrolase family 28 protein [Pelobium manganitolerans]RKD17150.1 glycoside hydrolase [Pelobium manganitolerans]